MKRYLLFSLLLISLYSIGQPKSVSTVDSLNKKFYNWYNLSPENKYQGASVEKAYDELLKDLKPSKKIVVAVIDAGVDINHPDLQGMIWINKDEVAGNGIDDDNNGYIDDIHGWNFIGGTDGENVLYENMEYVRIVRELTPKFGNIASKDLVPVEDLKDYELYQKCKAEYDKEYKEYSDHKQGIEKFEERIRVPKEIIQKYLGKETFTLDDLKKIDTKEEPFISAKKYLYDIMKSGLTFEWLEGFKQNVNVYLDYRLNLNFDPRSTIVKDDPNDINDKFYGNNDVKGPRSYHGTLVAGIIAANRDNSFGIKGINSSAEIMVLRAVPDGDERDKDIALAIRYAVDNGANIINMSFGKYYSLRSHYMDDAIKYADERNVLIVHSAGNESADLDKTSKYPSSKYLDGGVAKNMITVGANAYKKGKDFCGEFSNYGKNSVNIFAPGVDIISLYPENSYSMANGTSFSGPVVSGVAALVWSYYPQLTAGQLKEILLNSADLYPKMKVYVPGKRKEKEKVLFSELSTTGGTINAYNALIEASKLNFN